MDYRESVEPLYERQVWRFDEGPDAVFGIIKAKNADGTLNVQDVLGGHVHRLLPSDLEAVERPDHYQEDERVRFSFGGPFQEVTLLRRTGRYWLDIQLDDGHVENVHFWWLMPLHARAQRPTQLTLF